MNIGILSFWHVHAEGYAKEFLAKTGGTIGAVWDEDPERGKKFASRFGTEFRADPDAVFSDPSIEGVIVTAPTSMHGELIGKAVRAGKKVFSEKVLALTTAECLTIQQVHREKGTDLTLSLVKKCSGPYLFAKQAVKSGLLGRVTYGRMRNVHDGSISGWLPPYFYDRSQCGGGAMIDLGAHPMYLLNWLLGQPMSVQSVFTEITGHGVEDNAVSVIEFENGAIGVSETGFVSVYNPDTLELSGTKGTLLVRGNEVTYATAETGGKWVRAEALPQNLPSPLTLWGTGKSVPGVTFGIDDGVTLTKMMEAAYRSQESGKRVPV